MSERGSPRPSAPIPQRPRAATTIDRPSAEVAVALAKLHCYGDVVAQIGAAFLLAPERLAAAEARDTLEVTAVIPVRQLTAPAFASLEEWFALLGGDLRITLALAGLDPDAAPITAMLTSALDTESDAAPDPLAAFLRFAGEAQRVTATQGDDVTVEVRVALGKSRALAGARTILARRGEYLGTPEMASGTRVAVYYQVAAWNAAVAPPAIPLWETQGLFAADGRAVVVVCDAPGYLAGLALDVVGAAAADPPDWLSVSRAAWRQFVSRAEATRRLRAAEGSWPDAPRVVTPEHLRMAARMPGLEATAARLAGLRAWLAAAYLASAVEGSWPQGFTLRFAGPRPISCALAADEAPVAAAHIAGVDALARFAAWAYRDASSEKLLIARECLARELPVIATVGLAALAAAAATALEAAKANLVLYVRRNIERYFKARQAAQDTVAAYAETVRRAVGDLTGDVVDHLYRTVGVLAGVLLAGLLQPALSLPVVRWATLLYALYIAFVLGIAVRARRDRYRLERRAFAARLAALAELTETERAGVRAPASEADAYFRTYFRLAVGVYVALGVLALTCFVLLWTPLAPSLTLPHLVPTPAGH
jgi:hypothetical protein